MTVFPKKFTFSIEYMSHESFPAGASLKNLSANTGDIIDSGSTSGWGRSPGEGNDNPLQYSCLENPMDRGTWWATVHRGRNELGILK